MKLFSQKSLGEKYSYLPMVQPYTQIDNDSIDYEENEYPMMHRYKYMFTDESATFKKYSNRPFALPADFTEKVICTKNLSPLLKIKVNITFDGHFFFCLLTTLCALFRFERCSTPVRESVNVLSIVYDNEALQRY